MAMAPVCFCKDGGPAVEMRCLKNGVGLVHHCEVENEHMYPKSYRGDAWRCPHCNNVVVICGTAVRPEGHPIELMQAVHEIPVASTEEDIEKSKEKYVPPHWIGDLHG